MINQTYAIYPDGEIKTQGEENTYILPQDAPVGTWGYTPGRNMCYWLMCVGRGDSSLYPRWRSKQKHQVPNEIKLKFLLLLP